MNILVLGGGGREHALVKALKHSPKVKQVSCAPGNPGISLDATCYLTDPNDLRTALDLAKRIKPDLIVIGPEAPLAAGVSDALRNQRFNVFGPSLAASRLETSKVFSKEFMLKHKIPTANAVICTTALEVEAAAAEKFQAPWVVKADGLASGKGVRICESQVELKKCLHDFFETKTLGKAAQKVLLEEHLKGEELSLMLLIAGGKYVLLPVSQDHKRLHDKNKGPNTGGMGAFAPVKQWSKHLKKLEEKIIIPTLEGLKADKIDYRGVLYIGVMMTKAGPFVLEYNVRFGDPEAQVLLPLLDGNWAEVFLKVANGEIPKLKWKNQAAVCVVITAPGYPDTPQKNIRFTIDKKIVKPDESRYLLHASTIANNGYLTAGGRVLNAIGIDKTVAAARKKAYQIIKSVQFEGMHFRKDIAEKTKD
ncbi:MAG: phosphoribosylamine--glycine ligase [Oligoflexia bacterium]|nr:phosphoribosylamine--glycine ligase [Oligoflexia bacterium]